MVYQNRISWMAEMKKRFPKMETENDGSYIWCVEDNKTLGFWNIVGNYGKIN